MSTKHMDHFLGCGRETDNSACVHIANLIKLRDFLVVLFLAI